jgi:hypothetical protein
VSSTLLYLAIVAVWAVVLVPMYLRRDTDTNGISRLRPRKAGVTASDADDMQVEEEPVDVRMALMEYGPETLDDETTDPYEETLDEDGEIAGPRRLRRSTVIARRRRRTFFLVLSLIAATAVVAAGVAPWWVALPPVGLFSGHLALLRTAVGMDVTRRERIARLRVQARAEARAAEEVRLADEAVKAEIIDLAERARARDVFDQYAEDVPRAVGD